MTWRHAREPCGELEGLAPRKRGPKAQEPQPARQGAGSQGSARIAHLKAENAKLQIICEVQKSLLLLLGVTLPTIPRTARAPRGRRERRHRGRAAGRHRDGVRDARRWRGRPTALAATIASCRQPDRRRLGRWGRRAAGRARTCCTSRASSTWRPSRSMRRCSTRAATSARSARCTGFSRPIRRCASGARPAPPPEPSDAPSCCHAPQRAVELGHHQAARAAEVDVLLPVRDPGRLQSLRGRLDDRARGRARRWPAS